MWAQCLFVALSYKMCLYTDAFGVSQCVCAWVYLCVVHLCKHPVCVCVCVCQGVMICEITSCPSEWGNLEKSNRFMSHKMPLIHCWIKNSKGLWATANQRDPSQYNIFRLSRKCSISQPQWNDNRTLKTMQHTQTLMHYGGIAVLTPCPSIATQLKKL